MTVDELAAALCRAFRRLDPYEAHGDYFGLQPCPECVDLARAVRDELEPAPRLQ